MGVNLTEFPSLVIFDHGRGWFVNNSLKNFQKKVNRIKSISEKAYVEFMHLSWHSNVTQSEQQTA
jgi:hypothetical protein